VIADEAHRSQYDFIDGFARYMRARVAGEAQSGLILRLRSRGDAAGMVQ